MVELSSLWSRSLAGASPITRVVVLRMGRDAVLLRAVPTKKVSSDCHRFERIFVLFDGISDAASVGLFRRFLEIMI